MVVGFDAGASKQYFEYGVNYYIDGDYDEAEKNFKASLKKSGKDSESFYFLGMIEKIEGNYDKAEYYFLKSIREDKYNTASYESLSDIYVEESNFELAIEYYTKAIQYKSSSLDAFDGRHALYAKRAKAYERLGEKWLALEDYKRSLLHSKNSSFLNYAGSAISRLEKEVVR